MLLAVSELLQMRLWLKLVECFYHATIFEHDSSVSSIIISYTK